MQHEPGHRPTSDATASTTPASASTRAGRDAASTTAPAGPATVGLRERKKARTKWTIQRVALQLFVERGYTATTVEQIAAAAEVSPSTFFRYFPTKEAVVLSDEFDDLLLERLAAQPPEVSAIHAIRRAFDETFADMADDQDDIFSQRDQLIMSEPSLRAGTVMMIVDSIGVLTSKIAERSGRSPDDLEILSGTGAIIGSILAVVALDTSRPLRERFARANEALGQLERGVTL